MELEHNTPERIRSNARIFDFELSRDDVAALSSRSCMKLYNLECLAESVQDQGNNYTRFICIAREPEIYPGSNRVSLMLNLPHEPGSLYELLSHFAALDLNVRKLESRPIPGSDFEFTFYFDLEADLNAPGVLPLLGSLSRDIPSLTFLGA